MRKLLTVLILFISGVAFAQTTPTTPPPANPQLMSTNTVYQDAVTKKYYVYNGSTFLWRQLTDSLEVKRMIEAAAGGVTSFNGRSGAVVPLTGDYSSFYYPLSSNPAGYLTSTSLAPYVPYTGATGDVVTTHDISANSFNSGVQLTNNEHAYLKQGSISVFSSNNNVLQLYGGFGGNPYLNYQIGGFQGNLKADNITAGRTWQLPDNSGTVAVLTDIPNLLPSNNTWTGINQSTNGSGWNSTNGLTGSSRRSSSIGYDIGGGTPSADLYSGVNYGSYRFDRIIYSDGTQGLSIVAPASFNPGGNIITWPAATGTVALTSNLSNYVDLTTDQNIGGSKTFNGVNISFNSIAHFNSQALFSGYTEFNSSILQFNTELDINSAVPINFNTGSDQSLINYAPGGGLKIRTQTSTGNWITTFKDNNITDSLGVRYAKITDISSDSTHSAATYVKKSGDTMTGQLITPNIVAGIDTGSWVTGTYDYQMKGEGLIIRSETSSAARSVALKMTFNAIPTIPATAFADWHGIDIASHGISNMNTFSRLYPFESTAVFEMPNVTDSLSKAVGGYFQVQNSSPGVIQSGNNIRILTTNKSGGKINDLRGVSIETPSNTGGSTIDTYYGLYINQATATGITTGYGIYSDAVNNHFRAAQIVPTNTTEVPLYINGVSGTSVDLLTVQNNSVDAFRIGSTGNIGVSATPGSATTFIVGKNITGGVSSTGILSNGQIQSGVTGRATYFNSSASTAATSFTLGDLIHFRAVQGTFGAGSVVTTQNGFSAESTLIGATNNYGFRGQIAAGTGRNNLRMDGTATNILNGNVRIGSTVEPTVALDVTGAALISSTLGVTGAVTLSNYPTAGVLHTTATTGALTTGAVNLASADVTGVLPAANGGTNLNATQTTVSGSTSGNAKFSQPEAGTSSKRVIVYMAALVGTASYTFPTAFTNTPVIVTTNGPAAGIVTALSTTAMTVTGATTTGFIILEGY